MKGVLCVGGSSFNLEVVISHICWHAVRGSVLSSRVHTHLCRYLLCKSENKSLLVTGAFEMAVEYSGSLSTWATGFPLISFLLNQLLMAKTNAWWVSEPFNRAFKCIFLFLKDGSHNWISINCLVIFYINFILPYNALIGNSMHL